MQFELRLDDGSLKDGAPTSLILPTATCGRGNQADYAGGYGKGSIKINSQFSAPSHSHAAIPSLFFS